MIGLLAQTENLNSVCAGLLVTWCAWTLNESFEKKQNLCVSRVDLRWNSDNRPEGYILFGFFLYHDGHSFPVFYRVLALVDGADPLQLFLCLPPPPGQAENSTAAEAERNQSDRLQRRLQLSFINAGPQYVRFILNHTCCSFWILNEINSTDFACVMISLHCVFWGNRNMPTFRYF